MKMIYFISIIKSTPMITFFGLSCPHLSFAFYIGYYSKLFWPKVSHVISKGGYQKENSVHEMLFCRLFTVCKLWKFTLVTLFWHRFLESNVFTVHTTEGTTILNRKLISRNIFKVWVNFNQFPHCAFACYQQKQI